MLGEVRPNVCRPDMWRLGLVARLHTVNIGLRPPPELPMCRLHRDSQRLESAQKSPSLRPQIPVSVGVLTNIRRYGAARSISSIAMCAEMAQPAASCFRVVDGSVAVHKGLRCENRNDEGYFFSSRRKAMPIAKKVGAQCPTKIPHRSDCARS